MAAITLDYEGDWETRLLGRLFTQFRDADTWNLWVTDVIAPQIQDLEDAFQTLLTLLDIDNSEGAELDLVGRIVGQPRLGTDDATYRTYISGRIQANLSDGSPEDLYDLFRAIYDTDSGELVIRASNIGVKAFVLRVNETITRAQAMIGVSFLGDAKEAGARGLLEWREQAESATFTYDGTTAQAYDNGKYAGAKQA